MSNGEFILSPRANDAVMNGTTDDTTALATTITQAQAANKVLWIDRPLFMGSPAAITVPADVTIQFVGDGALLWRFGTVREARIRNRGTFAATPTVSVDRPGITLNVTYRLAGVTLVAPGSAYTFGQILTLTGGTFSQAARLSVRSTQVVGTVPIADGGTGYPTGSHPFEIQGGQGKKAELLCTVSGGAVVSASLTYAGSYTTNPPGTADTERLNGDTGSGFKVGPLGFGIETVEVITQGAYTGVVGTLGHAGGGSFDASFEVGTATGSGGTALVDTPTVTVAGGGDAEIELIGDRPSFNGSLIGDLGSRFTGTYTAFKGTLQSTRLRPLATASPLRDLDERLRETVSVKDFGAVGDGRERGVDEHPLYAAIFDEPAAYDFVTTNPDSADKLKLIEPSDTLDWLAFELAIRYLAGRSGGTLLVPEGHYVTRRHINPRDGIEIRGDNRRTTIVENRWDTGPGYLGDFRPMVLTIGAYHPIALDVGYANRLARYNAIEPVEPATNRVRLSATDAARFLVGDFLMLGTIRFNSIGGHEHPRFAQINRVRAVEDQDLVCERPFKRPYSDTATAKARVRRFGTGRDEDAGFGGTPWLVRADVTIRNLTTRGGSLMQRTAGWNLRVEDVDHQGRNGLVHNAFVHSAVRRLSMITGRRGIETKGESFDVLFEDVGIVFESPVKGGAAPLLAVGESSEDVVYRRVRVQDGPRFGQAPGHTTAQVPRMRVGAYDSVIEDVTVACREPGSQALQLTTEHGGERTSIERLRLVSVNGALLNFARITNFETQTFPLVQARDVALVGTVSAGSNRFWIERAQAGSFIEDFSSTAGYTPNGGGLSSASVVKSTRLYTMSDVRNADRVPNTDGKSIGDRVVLDTGAAIFADGPNQFDTWSYVPKVDGVGGLIAIKPGRSLRDKDQSASLRWNTAGSDVYYVTANPSGNPGLNGGVKPGKVFVGDNKELTNNDSVATLGPGEWAWAKPTGITGWHTVFVVLPSGASFPERDPDDAVYRDAVVRYIP